MTILVYGSLAPDVVFSVPRVPRPGEDVPAAGVRLYAAGGAGNVAVALASWGYSVLAAGNQIGDDPLGRWVDTELRRLGIEIPTDFVAAGSLTPANGIMVTPDGQRTIIGSQYSNVTWQPVPSWSGVHVCVVDAYSGAVGAEVAAAGRRLDKHVIGSDVTGDAAHACTWLVWSAEEHPNPAEAAQMADGGPAVIVTSGGDPLTLFHGSETLSIPLEPRTRRDSTGAGEVFTAALAASASDGVELIEAVETASDVAGRYVEWDRDLGIPPLATMGS